MTDPIEACEQRRQQIADATERLEAAANAWRIMSRQINEPTCDWSLLELWQIAVRNLIACVDELARLRGEG